MKAGTEYFNISSYLLEECNIKQGRNDKIALYYKTASYTYGELDEKINQYANYLNSQGIVKGNIIGMYMFDCPEFVFLFFGAITAGVIPAVMNPKLDGKEVKSIIKSTKAVCLFTEDRMAENLYFEKQGCMKKIQDVKVGAEQMQKTFQKVSTQKDDAAFILYTSGSSGIPKGAVHTQYSMAAAAKTAGRYIFDPQPEDIFYSHSKMSFAYGLGSLYIPLYFGASVVLNDDDNLYDIFDIVEKYRVTKFQAVPSVYSSLLMLFPKDKNPFRQCKVCVAAGEPLAMKVSKDWKSQTGLEIYQAIGFTEMLYCAISCRDGILKYGSIGKALPDFEIAILNEAGEQVKPLEIGNLFIKGETMMKKYWNNDTLTAQVMTEKGIRTGDMCYVDEEGYIWYAGRDSDAFKVNGVWQSALPIEDVIRQEENIKEVVVTNEINSNMDANIVAYIVLKEIDLYEETIKTIRKIFFREKMRMLCPKAFYVIDAMPLGNTGKIKRSMLNTAQVIRTIK